MQYRTLLVAALAGVAIAAPVEGVKDAVGVSADLPTITGALTTVENALTALDTAVKGLTAGGDPKAQSADIIAKSKAVEQALKDGTAKVSSTSVLSLLEAVQVQSASAKLTTLTQQTIKDLTDKKDIIKAAGQTKTTIDNLTAQKAASEDFVKAITGKVPSAVQSIAASASKSVGDALAKGIADFSSSAKRAVLNLLK
ncbi:hypothetical protein EJ08DRAFT_487280 [Tothia fuscella]|uniref:Uncharacterized protein n=1 Tax=Tothia fuscella TaxID=1048955 RepID=A0A9P4NHP7_9PEZI|nr:hypothetical protein EJ08DRAFT_487280 [Tothia fuscella]